MAPTLASGPVRPPVQMSSLGLEQLPWEATQLGGAELCWLSPVVVPKPWLFPLQPPTPHFPPPGEGVGSVPPPGAPGPGFWSFSLENPLSWGPWS